MVTETRPIAVIDCETDPFAKDRIPEPFIWGFYDGGFMDEETPYYQFLQVSELIDFLKDKQFLAYAHNGGKFDYHYMLEYFEPFEPLMIINGRIAKFSIGLCEFRDSFNIVPVPLAQWQKTEIDYSIFEKDQRYKPENWKKITDYLRDDCVNLYEMVRAFTDRFGRHVTQASASMSQWRKISGLKPPKSTRAFYDDFHPYYFGGRCECFEVGVIERDFKIIDINSAYPYAMLSKHPYELAYSTVEGLPDLSREEIGPAFIRLRCISYGAFPYREPDGLIFPRDNVVREYHVTGWEYLAAIETGTIEQVEVLETRVFTELVSFVDYIYQFYNERKLAKKQKDKAGDLFGKLFMNSLYGKFASNPDAYSEYILVDPQFTDIFHPENGDKWADIEGKRYRFGGTLGPWVIARAPLESDYQRYYNIATAASITGFVRAFLWRAICECKQVIYSDTDSIAAGDVEFLDFGNELGQWKVEGEFTLAGIAGKKLYAFKHKVGTEPASKACSMPRQGNDKNKVWKTASKGVRLSGPEIMAVAKGEEIIYKPEIPTYTVYGGTRFIDRRVKKTGKVQQR